MMYRILSGVILAAACLSIATVIFFIIPTTAARTTTVRISDVSFHATIADSAPLREKGLGDRVVLQSDEAMLFIFPHSGIYSFWMKDMYVAIDIIWLDEAKKIVHIAPTISPDTYPKNFTPPTPARYVLEIAAGTAVRHNIRVGDQAIW
jgi:uncharacterized protein